MRYLFITVATIIAIKTLSQHLRHYIQDIEPYELNAFIGSERTSSESEPLVFSILETRADLPLGHSEKFLVRAGSEYITTGDEGVLTAFGMLGFRAKLNESLRFEVFAGPAYEWGYVSSNAVADSAHANTGPVKHSSPALYGRAKFVLNERFWTAGEMTFGEVHERYHGEAGVKLGRKNKVRPFLAYDSLYKGAFGARLHFHLGKSIVVEPGAALTSAETTLSHVGALYSFTACMTL